MINIRPVTLTSLGRFVLRVRMPRDWIALRIGWDRLVRAFDLEAQPSLRDLWLPLSSYPALKRRGIVGHPTGVLKARNSTPAPGGQECPPCMSKVEIPTLRLRSGAGFLAKDARNGGTGHPSHWIGRGQDRPRNWMIRRRSRLDGLPVGNSSNCFMALRSAATFIRSSRLASVSR